MDGIFHRTRTNNLKVVSSHKNILNSQSNLETEEQSWRLHVPQFQIILLAIIIKTVWYWLKDGHIEQWNRTEPRNKPMHIWSTDFDKVAKNTHGERIIYSTNGAMKIGNPHAKE